MTLSRLKIRKAHQSRPRKTSGQAMALLQLEPLEDRFLPSAAPSLLKDISPGAGSSFPADFTEVNGTAFFAATDLTHLRTLWASNGTVAGTVLVGDLTPGKTPYYPVYLTNANGTLFFSANDGPHGQELWESNGAAAGTFMVDKIHPGTGVGSGSSPAYLTNVNGSLFFAADDGTHGRELWASNGSASGTFLVSDINPFGSSYPQGLTNVNDTLFFSANDGTHGTELWESNGTAAGTFLVKDMNPGSASSSPSNFTNVNGTLFFSATDGGDGQELWESNGAAAGTFMVADINPFFGGFPGSYPTSLTNVNGTLFFGANNEQNVFGVDINNQLWRSNGTQAGTMMVADINVGANANPKYLTNVNGTLFFQANDGVHGPELWTSDGSAAGTVLVQDINPGATGSYPYFLVNVNGTLFFSANDGVHGHELWASDGTFAGTQMVADLNPGSGLTSIGGSLLFAANDGRTGTEPWVLPTSNATSTTLTSSPNPSTYGHTVTFTATVRSAFGAAAPTGTVAFEQGSALLSIALLNSTGQATFTTAALAGNVDIITAVYSGDRNLDASEGDDSQAPQLVQQAPTSTVISASVDPSVFGQQITLTATVNTLFPAARTPTGTVTFTEGSKVLAAGVSLNGGKATFQTSALGFGSHLITASYSGDSTFSPNASVPFHQAVNPDATTASMTSSPSATVFGQALTFTASVLAASPGSGIPIGTVTFEQGLAVLGAGVLSGAGQATFSTTSLSVGNHTITAVYGGDSRFLFRGSFASPVVESVTQASSSTSLSTSPNPSVFGQPVVFTASVTATAPGGGLPAGVVQFKQGATVLGNVVLNGLGQALFQTIVLPVGSDTVTAVYLGNTSFQGSTSAAAIQAVNPDATVTAVRSSLNPAVVGNTVTLTAVVRAGAPGSGTPTGTVTFFDSALALGSGAVTGGLATFSTSSLSLGGHAITAVYTGEARFTGSTSGAFGQVVHSSAQAVTTATVNGAGSEPATPVSLAALTGTETAGLPNIVGQAAHPGQSLPQLALTAKPLDEFFAKKLPMVSRPALLRGIRPELSAASLEDEDRLRLDSSRIRRGT
jgi:ELWxxDGT repeat protein